MQKSIGKLTIMRVFIIIDNLVRGGKQRRMIELLKGLRHFEGVEVELSVFSRRVEFEEVFDLGWPIHFFERSTKKDMRVFGQFYRLCKERKPDIIHSWGSMTSIYALPAARKLGIKLLNAMIVDAPHDMKPWDTRLFRGKLTFPFSDLVLANSKAGLEAYGVKGAKGVFIHNGFDFNRISDLKDPDKVREELGINTTQVVGMVGAFEPRKDYKTFALAGVDILRQRSDVSFLAIGDGSTLQETRNLVPDDVRDRFKFTGKLKNVESVINIFNIGVLSSDKKVHGEGISNAILEYMALAKPVVATDCGGTAEIVHDMHNGFLVEDRGQDRMTQAILTLLDDPTLAKEMGKKGYELAFSSFNLDGMTEKFLDLYCQVLNKDRIQYVEKPLSTHSGQSVMSK